MADEQEYNRADVSNIEFRTTHQDDNAEGNEQQQTGNTSKTYIADGNGQLQTENTSKTYIADGNGQLQTGNTSKTYIAEGNEQLQTGNTSKTYIADGNGQLQRGNTSKTYIAEGNEQLQTGNTSKTYIADGNGQLKTGNTSKTYIVESNEQLQRGNTSKTYIADGNGQLQTGNTSKTYIADGNEQLQTGNTSKTYIADGNGQLHTGNTSKTYIADGNGQLQTGNTSKTYIADGNEQLQTGNTSKTYIAEVIGRLTISGPFHGATQLLEPQPFVLRRVLWILLCMGGTALCLIQLVSNLNYYNTRPVSVDIKINHNNSVTFPAVTICNVNSFRLSKAYTSGYYSLLSELFANVKNDMNITELDSQATLEQIYIDTAHDINQLLVRCKWEGSTCYSEDFIQVVTDFGVCYTFNSGDKIDYIKEAYTTGSGGGLSLELNIEQYEYMYGPNEGAGLKVLVHHNHEKPMVNDYGLAVQPGAQAFIATKIVEMNNLEPEYGKCNDSVVLEYYDTYTVEGCYSNCMQVYLNDRCHCRLMYMPTINSKPDSCTVEQFHECTIQTLRDFQSVRHTCYCPIDCHRRIYQAKVSHGSTSNFDIGSLLKDAKLTNQLKQRHIESRELHHKVDPVIVAEDTRIFQKFGNRFKELKIAVTTIIQTLSSIQDILEAAHKDLSLMTSFHIERGLKLMDENIVQSYILGWVVAQEETFQPLLAGQEGFKRVMYDTFSIANNELEDPDNFTRKLAYLPIKVYLKSKNKMVKEGLSDIIKVSKAYIERKRLRNLTNQVIHERYHSEVNDIKDIITDAQYLVSPYYRGKPGKRRMIRQARGSIRITSKGLNILQRGGDIFVHNGTDYTDTLIDGFNRNFSPAIKYLIDALTQITQYLMNPPHTLLLNRINNINNYNVSIQQLYQQTRTKIKELKEKMENLNTNYLESIDRISRIASKYLVYTNHSKHNLAEVVLESDVERSFTKVTYLFRNLQNDIKDIQVGCNSFFDSSLTVWGEILNEKYTSSLYGAYIRDADLFMADVNNEDRNLTEYIAWIAGYDTDKLQEQLEKGKLSKTQLLYDIGIFLLNRTAGDIERNIRNQTSFTDDQLSMVISLTYISNQFEDVYDELKSSMTQFIQDSEINEKFYKQNFLRIDVFMQELRYEAITQQKAYEIIQFLSDVGGSLGLFIGASLLSVVEIIDIFVHQALMSLYERRRKKQTATE